RAAILRVVSLIVRPEHIVQGLEKIDAQSFDAAVERTIELHPYNLRVNEIAVAVAAVVNDLRVEVENALDRMRLANAADADDVEPHRRRGTIRRLPLLAILIERLDLGC